MTTAPVRVIMPAAAAARQERVVGVEAESRSRRLATSSPRGSGAGGARETIGASTFMLVSGAVAAAAAEEEEAVKEEEGAYEVIGGAGMGTVATGMGSAALI